MAITIIIKKAAASCNNRPRSIILAAAVANKECRGRGRDAFSIQWPPAGGA